MLMFTGSATYTAIGLTFFAASISSSTMVLGVKRVVPLLTLCGSMPVNTVMSIP